jgi:Tfp pilus assembly protein PilE
MIELLVVILIIALLAEIAIPSFIEQSPKAYDAGAKAAVRTAATAVETYRVDHGTYCGARVSDLVIIEATLADARDLTVKTCSGGDDGAYSVSVTSRSDIGTIYTISLSSGSLVSRTCNTPSRGACPANGSW